MGPNDPLAVPIEDEQIANDELIEADLPAKNVVPKDVVAEEIDSGNQYDDVIFDYQPHLNRKIKREIESYFCQ